jgi:hypothetical protein
MPFVPPSPGTRQVQEILGQVRTIARLVPETCRDSPVFGASRVASSSSLVFLVFLVFLVDLFSLSSLFDLFTLF